MLAFEVLLESCVGQKVWRVLLSMVHAHGVSRRRCADFYTARGSTDYFLLLNTFSDLCDPSKQINKTLEKELGGARLADIVL